MLIGLKSAIVADRMSRGEVLYALKFRYKKYLCGLAPEVNRQYGQELETNMLSVFVLYK